MLVKQLKTKYFDWYVKLKRECYTSTVVLLFYYPVKKIQNNLNDKRRVYQRVLSLKGVWEEVGLGREPLEAFFVSMLVLNIFQYMGMNLDVCTYPVKTFCFKSFPGF